MAATSIKGFTWVKQNDLSNNLSRCSCTVNNIHLEISVQYDFIQVKYTFYPFFYFQNVHIFKLPYQAGTDISTRPLALASEFLKKGLSGKYISRFTCPNGQADL